MSSAGIVVESPTEGYDLDAETIGRFRRDGFVKLGGVLAPMGARLLRRGGHTEGLRAQHRGAADRGANRLPRGVSSGLQSLDTERGREGSDLLPASRPHCNRADGRQGRSSLSRPGALQGAGRQEHALARRPVLLAVRHAVRTPSLRGSRFTPFGSRWGRSPSAPAVTHSRSDAIFLSARNRGVRSPRLFVSTSFPTRKSPSRSVMSASTPAGRFTGRRGT